MELKDALRQLRGELGLSQTELAGALHVNYATINRWEAGRTTPNPSALAALEQYACGRAASPACLAQLREAVAFAKRAKFAPARDALGMTEHDALRQLIDDASFPIYVCDLETDDLLYLNRKAASLVGGEPEQLVGGKCYRCLLHRESPCAFCHKEELRTDRYTTFQAYRPDDSAFHLVQGKRIQWNGRKAHVRYIVDMGGAMDATTKDGRENAYAEQLRLRRQLAGNAVVVAHYNLTHDTVSDVVGSRARLVEYVSSHSLDALLLRLRNERLPEERAPDDFGDRRAMIQQFFNGRTHLSVRLCIDSLDGFYECSFDLMQNPVTYDIEAFAQLHDITDETVADEIAKRLFSIDYETIATIDAETGEARPYIGKHIDDVILAQRRSGDNIAGVEDYLRKYCADENVEEIIERTRLAYVKEQLATKTYYHVSYSLRQDGQTIYKRAVYAYLDGRRRTILCAMQNLTDLHALENAKRDQLADALQTLQEQGGMDIARYDLRTGAFYSHSAMTTAVGFGSVIEDVPETFIRRGLVAPSYVERYREFFAKLRDGEPSTLCAPCVVGDGSYHWLRMDAQLLYDKERRPYQALLAFRDIEKEREQASVYAKWRQSLEQKKPENYTLFRGSLNRDATYDKAEGTLLRYELFDRSLTTLNERARSYASRFVHIDDFDAYTSLFNTENLLASYYRGARRAELRYRERVSGDAYRSLHLTVELTRYSDASDIEFFALFEPCESADSTEHAATSESRAVFDDTGVMVVTCEWPNGGFNYAPDMAERIAGRYDDRPIWEVFLADGVAEAQDVKMLRQLAFELAESPERNNGALDLELRTPSGARHWFTINVFKRVDAHKRTRLLVMTLLDVHADILANKKLRFQAEHDSLTGLYNRGTFIRLVTETVRGQPADSFVLLCNDINDFELFNNRYGREEGDRLLQYAAERLRDFADQKRGFAGRLSNDVFAMLLPNTPGVLERAEAIIRGFFADYPLHAKITGRSGACVISDPGMKADTILDRAATAKDSIKGRYDSWLAVFNETMNAERLREKYVTDRMEAALAEDQFDVYIQPQFHHGSGRIVGAEALVRWNDPERGVVLPGEFIPVFEKNGFITQMDAYVWDKTARYISAWMAQGNEPVPISVNVSREDVNDPGLSGRLLAITDRYSIPTSIFRLEITESLFAENPKRLSAVVDELHSAGFLVEMDDFGSGYSSLNILKDVPVDVLKLDVRFFAGKDNLGRGGMILNAVLRMARWLGIPVIAEGVELKEQADFLLGIGCPIIQGYLYEKPLPAPRFEELLRAGGGTATIPHAAVESQLDAHSFWNPLSLDSRFFHDYIGPAFVFEYHNGEYEIVRMNKRFSDAMRLSESVMLPAHGLIHFAEESKPKARKAVLDAIYSGGDVTADLLCLRDDGSTPLLRVTLRVIAKSADRALVFASLGA